MTESKPVPELRTSTELNHPYSLCGRKCYVIGFLNGLFPDIGWHKTKEMGGVWMHPIKVADGIWLSVDGENWPRPKSYNPIRREWFKECDEFVLGEGGAWSEHIYHKGAWAVTRHQFVPQEEAALGVEIRVKSTNNQPSRVRLSVLVRFDILSTWRSGWPDPIHLETEAKDGGVDVHGVSGYDIPYEFGYWTAALRSAPAPDRLAIGERLWGPERTQSDNGTSVLMTYVLDVAPEAKVRFVISGDITGAEGAVATATRVLTDFDRLAQEKIDVHRRIANELTGVDTPEPLLNDAFFWGKQNLEWMTQYSPCLGTCVVAGHQDFTAYVGGDACLSIGGVLAAGLHETAKDSLRVLGAQAAKQGGRAAHEFSSTGHVHDPGNVSETPIFIKAVWQTYCWTGDEAFLKELYPTCWKGAWEYIPSQPIKDGVLLAEVEDRPGGARDKCITDEFVVAYGVFAKMAERMGDDESARKARAEADKFLEQTEKLFWVEEHGRYADRVDDKNKPVIGTSFRWGRPFDSVGFSGVCRKDRVVRALEQFEGPEHSTRFGLLLSDNCIMPLGTGMAAIAEFNYGRLEPGIEFLRKTARTMGHASPGAFPEGLDPQGDLKKFRHFRSAHWNYLQLWSAATYLEGLIWGVFHVEPDAARGKVTMTPRLPEGWPCAEVRNLVIGQTRMNVRVDKDGVKVTHVDGPKLDVRINKYTE